MTPYTLKPTPKKKRSILARILHRFGYSLHKLPPKGLKRKREVTG